jgi:hypothetical protein
MFFANPPAQLQDRPVVCSKQAIYMMCTSGLCAIVSAYGFYQGHYISSFIPLSVFITSINYWRHPIYGWRRNADVACVIFAFFSMLVVAYYAQHGSRYYIITILAASCYLPSHYFHNNGQEHMGTLMHSYIHILGNLALFVIFSGEIQSLFSETPPTKASTLSN